jgi:regulator of sirC expression with transglutaminase-like and TPR domain
MVRCDRDCHRSDLGSDLAAIGIKMPMGKVSLARCYAVARVDDDEPALLDLLAGKSTRIPLDQAALQIARIEYPDLDPGVSIAQLDNFAAAIADRAGDLSHGEKFIRATNEYLFGELGFRGNDADYYHPDNSCLNRVIETRLGIPITLSLIYIEVARRLAKPVAGVGLPGHFIVLYDDGRFRSWIDPFHAGALVDEARCRELSQMETLDPAMLAPVDKRYIAMRMVNNLRRVYFNRREPEKAVRILDLLIGADPASPDEHKQRAIALLQQQRIGDALAGFRRYLELSPDAPDRARIEEQIRQLAFWLASRN